MDKAHKYILWFDEIGIHDVPYVGGKNASLGEMYNALRKKGIRIPDGFAVTAAGYRFFLEEEGIKTRLFEILKRINPRSVESLTARGNEARQLFLHADIPPALRMLILSAYRKLCQRYGPNTDVAVRSSATAEDLPGASFAGQQDTFLNIRGETALLDACRRCFASLYTNRAIHYRLDKGFDHEKVSLSIGIQKMVRSDLASSGVMFSIDTETGFKDVILINGIWGMGENIVQGKVNPDEWYVHKPTLQKGFKPIISRILGDKKLKLVYAHEGTKASTKNIETTDHESHSFVLTSEEVLTLARWACSIEQYYRMPMDIEWAKDGLTGHLYIVQARPETIQSQKNPHILEEFRLLDRGKILAKGRSVGSKIGQGRVQVIRSAHEMGSFKDGNVLVTDMTDPDWEPIIKIASAIVTNKGGKTCHAAIISRELGIPCVVGTLNATEALRNNQKVTISCAEGEEGFAYEGYLKYKIFHHNLANLPKTHTKLMVNVGNPEQALELSFLPTEGVGLARQEFIISQYIKIHPNALISFSEITNRNVKEAIEKLTIGFKDKTSFYIERLAEGIATIGAAFYPKDVIVRFSDFKSNEYANLIGGTLFEPLESNPMIGWRGASRYYSKEYRDSFALECKALKKVRDEMGLQNVKVMIPFCRTVEEGSLVLKEMAKHGLIRGKKGLQVYVMCEIPSNVILADQFSELFDGFSIGTNDLTQLTLGLDRDSALVNHLYDEGNDAVKTLVATAISKAKARGKKIGICGEAGANPEFAKFLVSCGIDSISVPPDAVLPTLLSIGEAERAIRTKRR
ncbi:phosphoenolpyruvate synthase [Candidatus Woesearchaeota archaeon]|nr:phosphoenolpyruvate synthase [Candidatus Woesearchaeota archaeon]